MRNKDAVFLASLAALAAAIFLPAAIQGRTFFWGDLTYIHHPWRALTAEMVQKGELPLWNPYAYLGMPLAAQMQCAAWYPGTLPFYLFRFTAALRIFHVAHYFLAGAFVFLWLRRLDFPRYAAFASAATAMLWGGYICRIPFLNHASTLAYFPALLLFEGYPVLLALSLSLGFLSGYVPMLAGEAAAAYAFSLGLRCARAPHPKIPQFVLKRSGEWLAAGLLAAALAACLLLPGFEAAISSRRGVGLAPEESLTWSFALRDLKQFFPPWMIPAAEYSPTVFWWKTCYLGLGTWAAAILGLSNAGFSMLALHASYLAGVLLVVLGGSNPFSAWIWRHWLPLQYLRYPGNMSYLIGPAVWFLTARGSCRRPWLAGLIASELFAYAIGSQPTASNSYFTRGGPLVRALAAELGPHRYLISPRALEWQRGMGSDEQEAFKDLKYRLYGVTNMPYHLSAAANFGEPLVPQHSYALMDFLYRRRGLSELAPYLAWSDVRILLTKDLFPPAGFTYLGDSLWHIYRAPGPGGRAFWFEESAGERIPAGLDGRMANLDKSIKLGERARREDRFRIEGSFPRPGWLYVCEPRMDGWSVFLNSKLISTEPAFGAFYKIHVPSGGWSLLFRYSPASWWHGIIMSLSSIGCLAAYGCMFLRRPWSVLA